MKAHVLLFFSLLALALAIRLATLINLPPTTGFGFEEDQTAQNALQFNIYDRPYVFEHFFTNLLPFISFKIVSPSITHLRVPFVIVGSLTVPLLYLLITELTSWQIGLWAAVLLLFTRWHIFGSTAADELFTGVFFQIITLYFFVLSLKKKNWFFFLLCGLFLGMSMYEYLGYRIMAVFIIPTLFIEAIREAVVQKKIVKSLLNFGCFLLMFIAVTSPLIYESTKGDDLLVEGFRRHANDKLGTGYKPITQILLQNGLQLIPENRIIWERSRDAFVDLFVRNTSIQEMDYTIPLFDPVTGWLLCFSILFLASKINKGKYLFFLLWITSATIISLYFPSNFYSGRFTSLLGVFIICISLFLHEIKEPVSRLFNKVQMRYSVIYALLLLVAIYLNMSSLFSQKNSLQVLQAYKDDQDVYKNICNTEKKPQPCRFFE